MWRRHDGAHGFLEAAVFTSAQRGGTAFEGADDAWPGKWERVVAGVKGLLRPVLVLALVHGSVVHFIDVACQLRKHVRTRAM